MESGNVIPHFGNVLRYQPRKARRILKYAQGAIVNPSIFAEGYQCFTQGLHLLGVGGSHTKLIPTLFKLWPLFESTRLVAQALPKRVLSREPPFNRIAFKFYVVDSCDVAGNVGFCTLC